MERRKKGSGRITYVEDRKSPWRATVTDSRGKQKTRFFKTEKEAKAFLREINADASKLKALTETGVTFSAFSQIFLDEKKKSNLKVLAYKTLESNVERACSFVGSVKLGDIDSDMIQQMIFTLAEQGYSESVMTKAKIAVHSVLKMAAAKHYIDTVPVLNITIPRAKKQDDDRQVKKNWLRDDEYSKTLMVDKNTVYADGEKITHTPKTESGERLIILNRQAVQDLTFLRQQFEEQSKEIEHRKVEELRQAELNFSGPKQKSAKLKIKEKYAAIEREHKYICGSSTFPFGSGGHSSIRTTMEIYAHLEMTQNRYVPRTMEDLKEF